jgi:hypothetical protein
MFFTFTADFIIEIVQLFYLSGNDHNIQSYFLWGLCIKMLIKLLLLLAMYIYCILMITVMHILDAE